MELNYFVVASVLLLALSEVLIVVSLFSSDWLISDYVGKLLFVVCSLSLSLSSLSLTYTHTHTHTHIHTHIYTLTHKHLYHEHYTRTSHHVIYPYTGQLRLGLSISCHSSPNVDPLCTFGVLHSTWSASVIIMIGAISSLTISMALLVVSLKKRHASLASAGKWAAFAGSK